MTEEHVGKVVDGRYRLDQLLGEGATGAVYAATQLSVDRTVAVKLLHEGDDPQFARRFESEAKAIGKLNHTNIITLHDFGFDEELGVHYIATEYAEGPTLAERMKEMMSTDLILEVALEIASAMHHAHAKGILHRDLKPENVILTRADGRVDVPKVVDFGLARVFDENSGVRDASQSQIIPQEESSTALQTPASDLSSDEEVAERQEAEDVTAIMNISSLRGDSREAAEGQSGEEE